MIAQTSIIVGIDPGTHTGVAGYSITTKKLIMCETDSIIGAMKTIEDLIDQHGSSLEIWFEDARKRKYFGKSGREKLQGAGSIKRDSAIWEQFCKYHGIKYSAIPPQHISTKQSKDVFARITGWTGRTSCHARDAAMIVYKSR